jgi:hypothetical protein
MLSTRSVYAHHLGINLSSEVSLLNFSIFLNYPGNPSCYGFVQTPSMEAPFGKESTRILAKGCVQTTPVGVMLSPCMQRLVRIPT